MNTSKNWSEDPLPQKSVDSHTAIIQILDNLWLYSPQWNTKNEAFRAVFSTQIAHIVDNLPLDKSVKNDMKKDILDNPDFLVQFLDYITGYLSNGVEDVALYVRACLQISQIEWWLAILVTHFDNFENQDDDTIIISRADFLLQLLSYLRGYISKGVEWFMVYVQTCIQVSQLDIWEDILMTHLARVFATLPRDKILSMIEDHGYVGGEDWDGGVHIDEIMDGGNYSREDAKEEFEKTRQDCAGFHAFLATIYNEYISPTIWNLPKKRQIEIHSMLNDFRDIVDPEGYIPLFFDNGNSIEMMERNKAVTKWREIH
jgi:hypothetical protein